MANIKANNGNIISLLTDWYNSPTNRGNILYINNSEVNAQNLVVNAFNQGLVINIAPVPGNNFLSEITFVTTLN